MADTPSPVDRLAEGVKFRRDLEELGVLSQNIFLRGIIQSPTHPTCADLVLALDSIWLYVEPNEVGNLLRIIEAGGTYDDVPENIKMRVVITNEALRLKEVLANLAGTPRTSGGYPLWALMDQFENPIEWW